MTKQNKEQLALGYLLNILDIKEKLLFFELLSKDDEIRTIFKAEKKLTQKLESMSNNMPDSIKNELYNKILVKVNKTDEKNELISYFKKYIVNMVIPSNNLLNKYIKEMC